MLRETPAARTTAASTSIGASSAPALIPILTVAPADHATRGKWPERLFVAVQSDGVEYLAPLEDRWGEIAQYPDLINDYADRMIGMVRRFWTDHQTFQHVIGTSICLSCLLDGGRCDELQELLATRRMKFLALAQIRRRGVGSSGIMGSRDRVCRSGTQQHKSWLL